MKASKNRETAQSQKESAVYINRNFAFLFTGRFISLLGDSVFNITLSLWIALQIAQGQPWAPVAVGGVLIAAAIPVIALGSFAGVFVDRWQAKPTMLRMDGFRAIMLLLLLLVANIIPLQFTIPAIWKLGLVYIVVFCSSVCSQFFSPSSFTLINEIVAEQQRSQASGMLELASGITVVIGPSIGTLLYIAFGAPLAILLNAMSYVFSFLAIGAIRLPPAPINDTTNQIRPFLREYQEGLTFVWQSPALMAILGGVLATATTQGSVEALGIFFYKESLHAPLNLFGVLVGAIGGGSIIGAIISTLSIRLLGIKRLLGGALFLAGCLVILFSLSSSFLPAFLAILMIGMMVAMVNVAAMSLILQVTPKEMVGRVIALLTSLLSAVSLLAIFISSNLASTVMHTFSLTLLGFHLGPYNTLFIASGVMTILGSFYATWNLRGLKVPADS